MRSQRSVLALRYTPVSVAGGVRRAVGGFVRYVQYRDQHLEPESAKGVDAYVRYVAHRDRTSPIGRIFSRDDGTDRRSFIDFVTRSTKGLAPRWVVGKDGKRVDRQRAVYTFILSPEDWRGLELRQLARDAMRQLESDAGPVGIGPWFAAEHRNTAHHHVHIVLAARREMSPGRFGTLVITRDRLQRMKDSIALEIDRQRGREGVGEQTPKRVSHLPARSVDRDSAIQPRRRWRWEPRSRPRATGRRRSHPERPVAATVIHLRAVAKRYRAQMEQELEWERLEAERESWL